jgi:hypothetical protein
VEIEFYGTVLLSPANSTEIPVTVIRDPDDVSCDEFDATESFSAVVSGRKVFLRRGTVGGSPAPCPPHGTYKVRPKVSGGTILVCGGLASSNIAVSSSSLFQFRIGRDCNNDNVLDDDQNNLDTNPADGVIDSCEINGGPLCNADFNYDGFLDFFDYESFLLCFTCEDCRPSAPPTSTSTTPWTSTITTTS